VDTLSLYNIVVTTSSLSYFLWKFLNEMFGCTMARSDISTPFGTPVQLSVK
jgi:hypothetical protein